MRENLVVTKICKTCNGKGWIHDPTSIFFKPNRRCRNCHGEGVARYDEVIYSSKSVKLPKVVKVNNYKYVKKYREKDKEHYNKIQRRYRRKEKYLSKFRVYLRKYRAMKKAGIKTKPIKKKVPRYEICTKCKKNPRKKWDRSMMCIFCIAKQRKELLKKVKPYDVKELVKLRDVDKLTFSEIARRYDCSRQWVHQLYIKHKKQKNT